MKALLAAILVWLTSCSAFPQHMGQDWTTLLVINETATPIHIYNGDKTQKFGVADPGANCINLRYIPPGSSRILFVQTAGPTAASPLLDFTSYRGWVVTIQIGRLAQNVQNEIIPDGPCKERH